MIYFSIDCEASGPIPPLYSMLSLGATVVRPDGDHHVIGESFFVELKPVFPGVDPAAMAVCGLDLGRLEREGSDPKEALARLSAWVAAQNAGSKDDPCFVGHNAVFDWSYVNYYYLHYGLENPFGYKGIDTKSLAMGALGIGWKETSKESLERLLRLPPQDPGQIHRADYDAAYQALILKAILDRKPRRA